MNCLRMDKKWLPAIAVFSLAVLFLPAAVFAAPQFGLGISITEDGQVIHCPIKLDQNLRLEGSLGIHSYDRENSGASDTDSIVLKFGGYMVRNVYEKTDIYYGGKVIYEKNDTGNTDQNGYGIGPAFGFEYYITGHISVGGEAEVYYMFHDRSGGDAKEYGTDSRVILRYYF
ncbi:MAG: hypothetical protein ABIK15_08910 [Pseudomonadota bacterium]